MRLNKMNIYLGTIGVLFGLYIAGFLLSLLISYLKCSKLSMSISAIEALYWTILPSLMYFIGNYFTTVRSWYSEPLKEWFKLDDEKANLYGIAYIMILASWIMTTRMLHTTQSAVCQPSSAELKKFEDDLEKEIKEKEAKKNNGGDSVSKTETTS
jgi:hypothetical protein